MQSTEKHKEEDNQIIALNTLVTILQFLYLEYVCH